MIGSADDTALFVPFVELLREKKPDLADVVLSTPECDWPELLNKELGTEFDRNTTAVRAIRTWYCNLGGRD